MVKISSLMKLGLTVWLVMLVSHSATGAPIVSPLKYGNLRLWLTADVGVVKDENNRVSKWEDQSGNGNHFTQKNARYRPTWASNRRGTRPVIEFKGSNRGRPHKYYLDGQIGRLPPPVTVFALVKFHSTHPCPEFVPASDPDRANNPCGEYVYSLGKMPQMGRGTGNHISFSRLYRGDYRGEGHYYCYWGHKLDPTHGHLFYESRGPTKNRFLVAGKWHSFVQRFRAIPEPQNHLIWLNGQAKIPQMATHATFDLFGDMRIGDWGNADFSWPLNGQISELLIYGREFTDSERKKMEAYLDCKAKGGCFEVSSREQVKARKEASKRASLDFSQATNTVRYSVPMASDISISLLDAQGRTLRVIRKGHSKAGRFETNANLRGIGSGLFFLRMTAGGHSRTKKLVLL